MPGNARKTRGRGSPPRRATPSPAGPGLYPSAPEEAQGSQSRPEGTPLSAAGLHRTSGCTAVPGRTCGVFGAPRATLCTAWRWDPPSSEGPHAGFGMKFLKTWNKFCGRSCLVWSSQRPWHGLLPRLGTGTEGPDCRAAGSSTQTEEGIPDAGRAGEARATSSGDPPGWRVPGLRPSRLCTVGSTLPGPRSEGVVPGIQAAPILPCPPHEGPWEAFVE